MKIIVHLPLLVLLGNRFITVVAATAQKCFADGDELKAAFDEYIDNGCNDDKTNGSCSVVSETYGHPMNSWCVGNVTNMIFLFSRKEGFNEDISSWDVSSVKSMSSMFSGASSFNGDLSSWNTSSVEDMFDMFSGATSFNGNISSWNTSNVQDIDQIFGWRSAGATHPINCFYYMLISSLVWVLLH